MKKTALFLHGEVYTFTHHSKKYLTVFGCLSLHHDHSLQGKAAPPRPPLSYRYTVTMNPFTSFAALMAMLYHQLVGELLKEFGVKFSIMLFSTYFGVKGALYTLLMKAQTIYYRKYLNYSGSDYQRFRTFASTPWALKAAIGALSDTVTFRGRHKTPYMVGSTIMGIVAFILVSALEVGDEDYLNRNNTHCFDHDCVWDDGCSVNESLAAEVSLDVSHFSHCKPLLNETDCTAAHCFDTGSTWIPEKTYLPAFLFFLIMTQVATVDLLTEGRYARMMVDKPHTGSTLVTWVWLSYFSGALAVSGFAGFMLSNYHVRFFLLIGVPFSVQVLFPLMLGFLREEVIPQLKDKWVHLDKAKMHKEHKMYLLAVAMTVGALINAFAGILVQDEFWLLAISWGCGISMVLAAYWALPLALANANTYMFLANATYLNIGGALDSWFLGNEKCVPGGPNFSYEYYFTYTGLVGSFSALLGTILFRLLFQDKSFRVAFWATTVLKVIASMFDYVMVKRWHLAFMSDKVWFLFGDAIIAEVISQLDFMPSVVLVSKVCPRGYESMVYAMLGGFQNFGQQVASNTGIVLGGFLGVDAEAGGDVCHFGNLPLLIFLAHALFPLITVPLTFFMIPNKKLTDDILEDVGLDNVGHTHGDGNMGEMIELESDPADIDGSLQFSANDMDDRDEYSLGNGVDYGEQAPSPEESDSPSPAAHEEFSS